MRRTIFACGLLLAVAGIFAGLAPVAGGDARDPAQVRPRPGSYWSHRIRTLRTETWHWQHVMGVPLAPGRSRRVLASSSPARLRGLAALWRRRERRAWRHAHHPPLLSAWLCIHRYEAAWNDAGGPYWGGLQMDLSFQQRYGGWLLQKKGTANRWTPIEQIWVAVRAWRSRGFSPWPNTARACGLL